MYKKIFAAILLFVALASCKSKEALKYSNDIVTMERSLEPEIVKIETRVERFVKNKMYDSIAVAGEKMEGRIQEKIDKLLDMPLPDAKGGSEFKTAALRYFRYMKSVYTGYKNWGKAETDEEREAELEKIMELVNGKEKVVADMQKAQKKYADENGFRVEK